LRAVAVKAASLKKTTIELRRALIANRSLCRGTMGHRPGSSLYEESFDLSSSISKKNSEVKKIKAFKACGSGCPGRKKVKKMTHMALKLFCYHPPLCCRLTPQQPVKPQANTESLQRRQEWHGFCYVYMAAVILQIVAAHSVAWARFASRGTLIFLACNGQGKLSEAWKDHGSE
jgi:hypothetical protein